MEFQKHIDKNRFNSEKQKYKISNIRVLLRKQNVYDDKRRSDDEENKSL